MDHLFSSSKLKNYTLNDYEERYSFLNKEFNNSELEYTKISNIFNFYYYVKYIFNNNKYSNSVLMALEKKLVFLFYNHSLLIMRIGIII